MNLSVQDWHYLCSISTELISNGYVPKEVLDNPSFWENYTDLIGKGDFLDNPDKTRYQTFDESEVFVHMPESMKRIQRYRKYCWPKELYPRTSSARKCHRILGNALLPKNI